MSASYIVKSSAIKEELELDSADGILLFFIKDKKEQGELYIKEISGVKIKYNTLTGVVNAVSSEKTPGVKNYYSAQAFYQLINPIVEVICLLAKFELLIKLDGLGDDAISNIIRNNHFNSDTSEYTNISKSAVDKTLKEIRKLLKPTLFNMKKNEPMQRVVYQALESLSDSSIKCIQDVKTIFEKINHELSA